MLHRAVLGSLERFLGILIENYAGAMPAWLHFEQAAVVPVSPEFNDYAEQVTAALKAVKIRANAYTDETNMKNKIKLISSTNKTPYILVVGQKEKDDNAVCVRFRASSGLEQKTMKLEEFKAYVLDKVATHFNGI